jgi:hypothetical protein
MKIINAVSERKALQNTLIIPEELIKRVSTLSIVKMIKYLKQRKVKISAYKQIHGKRWITIYQRRTITYNTNAQLHQVLVPIVEEQIKKQYQEFTKKRYDRERKEMEDIKNERKT